MKLLSVLVFALSLISYAKDSFRNNVETDSLYLYHPIQIGNVWKYHRMDIAGSQIMYDGEWSIEIKRDTVIDSKKCMIIESNGVFQKHARFDTLTGNYYENEILIDSTKAIDIGNYPWANYLGLVPKIILEDTAYARNISTYVAAPWMATYYTHYALGYGLVYQSYSGFRVSGTLELKYAKINGIEYNNITGIQQKENSIPSDFKLEQNYPNPFNPSTTIVFSIPISNFTTLKIYDLLGREIELLVNETLKPGDYKVVYHPSQLSSGVYIFKIASGAFVQAKRMLLVK